VKDKSPKPKAIPGNHQYCQTKGTNAVSVAQDVLNKMAELKADFLAA